MTWEWTLPIAFNVAGSVAIAAFGILVALVRPRTPQATVVAVFSVAFGLATACVNLAFAAGTTSVETRVLGWGAGVAAVVLALAVVAMWWALPVLGRPRGVSLVLALVSTGVAAAVLAIPILFGQLPDSSAASLPHLGLYFGVGGLSVGTSWGLIFVLASRLQSEPDAMRGQTALLAGALAIYPANHTQYLLSADPFLARLAWVTLAFVLVAAATWLWAGERAGQPRAGRNVAWIILGVALLGTATSMSGSGIIGEVGLSGVARIAMVAVLSYAVVRHHALGIDAKLRFGISKSTIAAVFIAVFFIASEAAQQFFGDRFESGYLGILAAGALVFAIAPLSRVADRLAEKAVPLAAAPVAAPSAGAVEGRRAVFADAVRRSLRDGAVTREEETYLARLATELGLDYATALGIRHDVEAESTAGGQ